MPLAASKLSPAEWAQALSLLDDALDQPAASQADWLAGRTAGPEVLAAVQRMLAERRAMESADFLGDLPAGVRQAAAVAPDEAVPGAHFGPYRLVRELGRGGMSRVWLAERDDGQARRAVAVKLPHTGTDRQQLALRLLRERDLLAALEHPNIARLYDIGVSPQGTPFMVLEYVPGQSLPEHCDSRRLGVAARLGLFLQVLRAVQHAHGKLVLHRDLKPSNILVTAEGEVKLLDFGIARPLHDAPAGAENPNALTQVGTLALTPDYAAPEQILGQPLGTACDVYALGVVLHELLTGQRPYRLLRGTRGELEQAILEAEPRAPSQAWSRGRRDADTAARAARFGSAPEALRRALAGDLDAIVGAALQKDPRRRTPSADALAQDIQRHLAHQPVLARAPSRAYRAARFLRRHALAVSAGGLVAASLATGAGVALWQAGVAREEAARAVAIRDFLVSLFRANSLDQADALARRQRSVEQLLEDSAASLSTGLGQQPALRAELQSVVGELLHELALTERAEQVRRERVAQLRALGSPPLVLAQALDDLARTRQARGEAEAARRDWLEASALLEGRRGQAEQRRRMVVELALAGQDLDAARLDEATRRVEAAVATLARDAADTADMADALSLQARLRYDQGRMPEVLPLLERALAVAQGAWRDHPAAFARWRYRHARQVWALLGRADLAEPHLRAASALMRSVAGADSLNTALIEQELGRAQLEMGRMTQAQQTLAEARRVMALHADQVDPELLHQAALLGVEAALANGRLDQAVAALAGVAAPLPADSRGDNLEWPLYTALVVAGVQQQTGAFAPARRTLEAWLAYLRERYADRVASVMEIRLRLAGLTQAEGRSAAALAEVDALVATAGFADLPANLRTMAHSLQASLQMDLGRYDLALPTAQALFQEAQSGNATTSPGLLAAAHNRLGRALLGQGQAASACEHLGQAARALEGLEYDDNPALATVRADLSRCLAQLGRRDDAQALLLRAESALNAQPLAGPQYHLPLRQARDALRLPPPAPPTVTARLSPAPTPH